MAAQPQTCDNRYFNILQTILTLKLLLASSRYKPSFLLVHLLLGSITVFSINKVYKARILWSVKNTRLHACLFLWAVDNRTESSDFRNEVFTLRSLIFRKGHLSKLSPLKPATRLELHKLTFHVHVHIEYKDQSGKQHSHKKWCHLIFSYSLLAI